MQRESAYDRMTNAEKEVAKTLKDLRIEWSYEQPVFIWDEDKRPRVWTPDFYLFQFGIYIEVCGSEKFDYEYRRKIFEKNGYIVIFLHLYKEAEKWRNHLLNHIHKFTIFRKREFEKILKQYFLKYS